MSQSRVSISIDAASVDSSLPQLDEALRGAEFFDVMNHPQITFQSTAYEETSDHSGRLTGDLSVRGVTHPVTLDVTINSAAMNPLNRREMIGFSAIGSFKRSDYGMTAYAPLVGDELSLTIQIEFEKAK
jgi:polyisoprenoid-binding protein YceI